MGGKKGRQRGSMTLGPYGLIYGKVICSDARARAHSTLPVHVVSLSPVSEAYRVLDPSATDISSHSPLLPKETSNVIHNSQMRLLSTDTSTLRICPYNINHVFVIELSRLVTHLVGTTELYASSLYIDAQVPWRV